MLKKTNKSRISSFTLVELITLIALFALLTVTLVPAMNNTMDDDRKLACMNNLKKTSAALVQYSMDFDGFIPAPYDSTKKGSLRWWSGTIMEGKYITEEKDIRCPLLPLESKNPRSETYGISRISDTGHSNNGFYRNLEKIEVPLNNFPIVADSVAKTANGVRQSYMWDTWYSTIGCLGVIHGEAGACNLGMADGHVVSWTNAEFVKYNKFAPHKIYAGLNIKGERVDFK